MRNPNCEAAAEGVYTLFRFGVMGAWPDERLVAQYLSGREGNEAAFRVLLRRHGPMVLGICRRTLGDSHLAEDAFQATFLVLVKKAGTIGDRDLLANWLYGVAQRVAKKAKAQAERRRVVERQAAERADGTNHPSDQSELRSVIDEEIRRLPERYRTPLVLCYLEGLTHHEAARQLGCPVGTIESRLSRARERLRCGLSRRGLAPASAALAAVLAPADTSAAPAHLIEATIRAATQLVSGRAGTGMASTAALALAERGLEHSPVLASGGKLGTLIACVVLVTAGLGAYQAGGPPGRRDAAAATPPALASGSPAGGTKAPAAEVNSPATDRSDRPISRESRRPGEPSLGRRSPAAIATPMAGMSIDGRLDDWPKDLIRYSIDHKLRDTWGYDTREKGVASDPDAYFMVGYGPEAGLIYLAVVVDDEDLVARFNDPMQTDAVEVYVDGLRSERSIPVPNGDWSRGLDASTMPVLQYAAVPGRGAAFGDPRGHNPSLVYGDIRETTTRMRYRREGDVTTYEWAIQAFDRHPGQPTRLQAGKRLGFDVAVVDKDRGNAPPAWFYWGPTFKTFKGVDAGNLGELILGTAP